MIWTLGWLDFFGECGWWWGKMLFFNERIWRSTQNWKPGGSEAVALVTDRGGRKTLTCTECENYNRFCYATDHPWAGPLLPFHFPSTYRAVRSFTSLVPAVLTPCGSCQLFRGWHVGWHFAPQRCCERPCWNAIYSWTEISLGGGGRCPGKGEIPLLLLHMCSTSWKSSSIAPEATVTLSKDNRDGSSGLNLSPGFDTLALEKRVGFMKANL